VYGQPALYVATADGVAFAGLGELDPARINSLALRADAAVRGLSSMRA
jgi:hypothetical protein